MIWFCLEGFEKSVQLSYVGFARRHSEHLGLKVETGKFFCNGPNSK